MTEPLQLTPSDRAMLDGDAGPATAMAMRILVRAAHVMQAPHLIDIASAHIDGCLYHGQTSLDFVARLVDGGARVRVPTTLNVGSLDLIHPELFQGTAPLRDAARQLMEAHLALGCEASFTCAPYQLKNRPSAGQQIAWAESNAIVFANSVLGARTNRYGDFIDLCAAVTGRAPYAGLHVPQNRYAQAVFNVADFTDAPPGRDVLFATLGLFVGEHTGAHIPVLVGLPADTTEDELKALGAGAASSGSVALFHAVGITPEAPTLSQALGGLPPRHTIDVSLADLDAVRRELNAARDGDPLSAVALGTPHFSLAEFTELERLMSKHTGPLRTGFYVNTSRFILWELEQQGLSQRLAARGVQIVVDTCTYITPIMKNITGPVMTNSGKWAHYAPGNIGVTVAYGSLAECVASAFTGRVRFHDHAGKH